MAWTVVDDDGVIQIRASIDAKQQDELNALITALMKRSGSFAVYDDVTRIISPKEATDV